jgi:hypothetical protein
MKIYLACPYSHPDPMIREYRYEAACLAAGILFQKGYLVYAPIPSWHHISSKQGFDGSYKNFAAQDISFIRWSTEVWVLDLPGRLDSIGVQQEISFAKALGKIIRIVSLENLILLKGEDVPKEMKR